SPGRIDPRPGEASLLRLEERGHRAVGVATAALEEIFAEWKEYLGVRNFTLLHQILEQLCEITDPYMR
ncbi:MarR family transcriptional regulator, partial [Mycobacteroides abscessus]|nr:MarR family transcriptional regulator [Mycobacteroides abscessus]MDM2442199.1 MarR family transcriptional regulator [Mycobacteroides abscessus]